MSAPRHTPTDSLNLRVGWRRHLLHGHGHACVGTGAHAPCLPQPYPVRFTSMVRLPLYGHIYMARLFLHGHGHIPTARFHGHMPTACLHFDPHVPGHASAETSGRSTQMRVRPTHSNSLRQRGRHGHGVASRCGGAASASTLLRYRDLPAFHAGLHEAGVRIQHAGARRRRSRTLGHGPGSNSHLSCQRGAAAADPTLGTSLPSQKGHPVLTTVKNGKNQGSI